MRLPRTAFAVCLLLASAGGAAAQSPDTAPARPLRSVPGRSLERTIGDFLAELWDSEGFFPTRGDWRWLSTTVLVKHGTYRGVQRIPAAQTRDAIHGPLKPWFYDGGLLPSFDADEAGVWHRSGTRFDLDRIFVQWRREDGRWVVDAIGVYEEIEPHVVGRLYTDAEPAAQGRGEPLHLPLPTHRRYAADQPWYLDNSPITVAGRRLVKYGLPRRLADGDVVLWGTYRGVAVFVEPQTRFERPDVVYLAVDPTGLFQPYQDET